MKALQQHVELVAHRVGWCEGLFGAARSETDPCQGGGALSNASTVQRSRLSPSDAREQALGGAEGILARACDQAVCTTTCADPCGVQPREQMVDYGRLRASGGAAIRSAFRAGGRTNLIRGATQ